MVAIIGMFLTFLGLELFLIAGILAVASLLIRMINPKAKVRPKDEDMMSAILGVGGISTLVGIITLLVFRVLVNT